jgi:putative endonuclease
MVIEKEWKELSKGPVYPSKYLYFITNTNRSEIIIGLTDDIHRFAKSCRNEHENLFNHAELAPFRLVYFEEYSDVFQAKERYRALSKWTRAQKEKLIRLYNQEWTDLSEAIIIEEMVKELSSSIN